MRFLGAAAALLALIVTMAAEQPTPASLGLGLVGIAAFAISCLFKGGKAVPSLPPAQQTRPGPTQPTGSASADGGLGTADAAANIHRALMAGVRPQRT